MDESALPQKIEIDKSLFIRSTPGIPGKRTEIAVFWNPESNSNIIHFPELTQKGLAPDFVDLGTDKDKAIRVFEHVTEFGESETDKQKLQAEAERFFKTLS